MTSTNSSGTTNYTWDARNRLTAISSPSLTASFKYDSLGRRIEKTINGTVTKYLYDGVDIIQEKNQSGAVTANYIRMLNIDEPLTMIKADGTIRHYVKDALGSIIALTDDSGIVKTTYTYDPFGNTTITGEASDNPFQYTGRESDNAGLYYYRARYYSPELQRFISEDPLACERKDGKNLFEYVGNNPINFVDPTGLIPEWPGGVGEALDGCGLVTCIKLASKICEKYRVNDGEDTKFWRCIHCLYSICLHSEQNKADRCHEFLKNKKSLN